MKDNISHKGKWVTFTLFGSENYCSPQFFRRGTSRIAYKTKNSVQRYLTSTLQINNKDKSKKSGVWQLTCSVVVNYVQDKLVVVLIQDSKNVSFHLRIIITILHLHMF